MPTSWMAWATAGTREARNCSGSSTVSRSAQTRSPSGSSPTWLACSSPASLRPRVRLPRWPAARLMISRRPTAVQPRATPRWRTRGRSGRPRGDLAQPPVQDVPLAGPQVQAEPGAHGAALDRVGGGLLEPLAVVAPVVRVLDVAGLFEPDGAAVDLQGEPPHAADDHVVELGGALLGPAAAA